MKNLDVIFLITFLISLIFLVISIELFFIVFVISFSCLLFSYITFNGSNSRRNYY
jgi:hypothetical protein